MHRNCEIRNANYEVCGSLLCSRRKQVQPQLLRTLQLEIVPELLFRASQASILYRTPSSSELLRDRQKELLSVKSCRSGHRPLEEGQAAGPEERLWNVIQCAPRFPPLRRITDSISGRDFQVSISFLSTYPWGSGWPSWLLEELDVDARSSDTHTSILSSIWTSAESRQDPTHYSHIPLVSPQGPKERHEKLPSFPCLYHTGGCFLHDKLVITLRHIWQAEEKWIFLQCIE